MADPQTSDQQHRPGSPDTRPNPAPTSPDLELQNRDQRSPGGTKEEEEREADREKPRTLLMNLRRDGRQHRRIGHQNQSSPLTPAASGTAVSGKPMLLLSNEARREMVKQVKAVREERRATLDARHKYLIGRLVEAGTLVEMEVEDAILADDKFDLIQDFFTANGSRKLIFFHQDENHPFSEVAPSPGAQRKLFLTTGSSEPLLGKCLFFLRTTDRIITSANIHQEVNFGSLDWVNGNCLKSLETLLSQVMVPALQSQQTWASMQEGTSCPQVLSFLSSVDRFIQNLSWTRTIMYRKSRLQIHNPDFINQLNSPADYISAARNSELVEHLEGVASVWTNQIKQVLTESEQMRKEADDVGPSAELEHWKRRMVTFDSLIQEVKRPQVKKTLGVLQVSRSRILQSWKDLDRDITMVANEAKNNVKFLYSLEKFLGTLGTCSPTSILDHLPCLMTNIRMIHAVSQYYNTSERMTSLLLKVTNQMIKTCRNFLLQGVTQIWDHSRPVLLQRISICSQLNEEYQRSFESVKHKLRRHPENRLCDFSENAIFGKFDAFCRHLEKIADMATTLESLSALQNIKVEGVEKVYVRYQTIVSTTKTKSYDILDPRKLEFHRDYSDFKLQVQGLFQSLQSLLDVWSQKPLSTERMLQILAAFESGPTAGLDLSKSYQLLLHRYGKELDLLKKTYQRQKGNPPIGRNLPPVAGRILWCRQLFRKVEAPMLILKTKLDILRGPDLTRIIRIYNRTAVVLLQYELLHLQGWSQTAEGAPHCLSAALLVRDENSKVFVNLDPVVLEVVQEARWMTKLGVPVPKVVQKMSSRELEIKALQNRLMDLVQDYSSAVLKIPPSLIPLLQPFYTIVEASLTPGLTSLSWTALNVESFIQGVYEALQDLDQVSRVSADLLECGIGRLLQSMSSCPLLVLPEDSPVSPDHLLLQTQRSVRTAAVALCWQSQQGERYVYELIEELKKKMKTTDTTNLEGPFQCLQPNSKQKTRCQWCLPCRFYSLIGQLCHRNTDALVKATKSSLDALRGRLHVPNFQPPSSSSCSSQSAAPPLFRASIQLSIPNIVLRPSLDDIQNSVNQLVSMLLSVTKDVPLWTFAHLQFKQQQAEQAAARDSGDDIPVKPPVLRPLSLQLLEHKDISKSVMKLSSIVSTLRDQTMDTLAGLSQFSLLWTQDPQEQVQVFLQSNPSLTEFSSQLCFYSKLEAQISELPPSFTVGPVLCDTEQLKLALTEECRLWKRAIGSALNHRASTQMDEVFSFVDMLTKRLQHPITDLEDVRGAMAALREVREAEVRIDATISPVEESYALLNKHELLFSDGNAERVDGLMYAWKILDGLVVQNQDTLIRIQPTMKADLLSAVKDFQVQVQDFSNDYNLRGPGLEGLNPTDASDRLQRFQAEFDHLWRKFLTYSGGEELFGLTINEYPELQRIRKELSLLSKLYSLYNSVIDSMSLYHDQVWAELSIEKINSELQDFQNRIRKLPKALKELPAFRDLKKTIDDFTETCPLLEMMANKQTLAYCIRSSSVSDLLRR